MFQKIKSLLLSDTSKDTGVSMIGNIGLSLGGMLFTIILARSVSPSQFGVFSALIALSLIVATIGDLGISAALVNFLPKLRNQRKAIISVTFWMQIIAAVVLGFILIGSIPLKSFYAPDSDELQIFLIAILTFLMILQAFSLSALKADRRFGWVSALQIADSSIKFTILLGLLWLGYINITTAIIATIISVLITAFLGLRHEFAHISFIFPKKHFRQIFHFAKWIAVNRTFGIAIARVDIILLGVLSSSFAAGIFSAVGRISLVFVVLVSSLGSVVAPRFSSLDSPNKVKNYLKKLVLLTCGISAGMLLFLPLARPIILLVFGSEYTQAIGVFQALIIAMIPFLFSIVTVNPLIYSFNAPNFVAITTVIQVIVLILLDLILIPLYGAYGPTIAIGISNLIVLALTGYKLKQFLVQKN